MEEVDPKDFLLFGLKHFNLEVVKQEGGIINLVSDYTIEIEGTNLYKLLHEGSVVAPFSDVEELCEFILKDRELNEQN